jgi:hypothetical protein
LSSQNQISSATSVAKTLWYRAGCGSPQLPEGQYTIGNLNLIKRLDGRMKNISAVAQGASIMLISKLLIESRPPFIRGIE